MTSGWDGRTNEQLLKDYEAQRQLVAQYDEIDKRYGISPNGKKPDTTATGTTGAVDKDWNSSNSDFSWNQNSNDLFSKAKEMSQMQLDQSFKMMDASANYRNAEYTHKSGEDRNSYTAKTNDDMRANNNQTDNQLRTNNNQADNQIRTYSSQVTNDMRRDGQQQSFQIALQNVNKKHDSGMQQDRFAQERGMFARQDAADNFKTNSARAAASAVFKMR